MAKQTVNPCIRCGKERVEGKRWKENLQTYAGISVVIHIDTVCPDKACQKIVEDDLRKQKEKKEAQALERKNRKRLN